ncbi:MAG: hypothetical protein HKN14_06405 [Marinicaulis sp.]|nr:hypothetical protein [Marinicaulis sp.]
MKFLIGLSTIQTVILIFAGLRLTEIDARLNKMETDIHAAAQAPAMITQLAYASETGTDGNVHPAQFQPIADADLRGFIVDELDRVSADIIAATGPDARYNTSNIAASAETDALKKSLENRLQTFVNAGRITETEMTNFQISIAKLPADDRQYMLSRLTQVMNTGAVDARF